MSYLTRQIQAWSGEFDQGASWRRFWFAPADPLLISFLRAAVGLFAFMFVLSHTADLTRWFSADGMLPIGVVQQLIGAQTETIYRPSYFYLAQDAPILWSLHLLGLAATLAMAVGWKTRWATPAALAVVLSYVHRAPMLSGQLEPVLCFSLLYLCFAPCGERLSLDSRNRNAANSRKHFWSANFALRLLQVHLAAFYLLMATSKLASSTWWQGDAVWWLSAYTETRLIDLSGILHRPFVFSFFTHLVVLVELSMAGLIWVRKARPFLLLASAAVWLLLAALTGLVGWAFLMIVLNLCFVPPNVFQASWPRSAPEA